MLRARFWDPRPGPFWPVRAAPLGQFLGFLGSSRTVSKPFSRRVSEPSAAPQSAATASDGAAVPERGVERAGGLDAWQLVEVANKDQRREALRGLPLLHDAFKDGAGELAYFLDDDQVVGPQHLQGLLGGLVH